MIDFNPNISIITLNPNSINTPVKRLYQIGFKKTQASTICCPKCTHLKYKNMNRLKEKGWRKIYQENSN